MRRIQARGHTQAPARRSKPLPRKVHLKNGQVWSYRIGGDRVFVRDPENKTTTSVRLNVFTGLTWDCLERLCWKSRGYWITPQDVKDFIENGFKPVQYKDNLHRFSVSQYERPGLDEVKT